MTETVQLVRTRNHNDGRSLLKQTRQQPRARKASWIVAAVVADEQPLEVGTAQAKVRSTTHRAASRSPGRCRARSARFCRRPHPLVLGRDHPVSMLPHEQPRSTRARAVEEQLARRSFTEIASTVVEPVAAVPPGGPRRLDAHSARSFAGVVALVQLDEALRTEPCRGESWRSGSTQLSRLTSPRRGSFRCSRELVLPESIGRIELAGDEAGYREGSGRSVPAVSSAGTADPWVGKGSLRSSVGGEADWGSAVG
jgi:hypothetical protein